MCEDKKFDKREHRESMIILKNIANSSPLETREIKKPLMKVA
ncbi:Uncharacterised protein [Kluyvera cryocrescens]|nr:Uncharacterised protein [Kluyvera cryocrescens]